MSRGGPSALVRLLLAPAVLLLAGCASGPPSVAPPTGPASGPAGTSVPASGLPPDCTGVVAAEHQAPEIEAQLPKMVGGRDLAIWSIRGLCVLNALTSMQLDEIDAFIAGFETAGDPRLIELDHLAYGVAGRMDAATDPPSFVFAMARPEDQDEIGLNLFLLLAGAGVTDIPGAVNLEGFETKPIGGKEVFVGTEAMLGQSAHQRGRPYLYQTRDTMFLVVTDDDTWAEEALGTLP